MGAAVILAAAGTDGCGVFQTDPPTLSGMQHQITTREQIGAATQAEAAQAEAAKLRAGVAARAQPLATDHKVTGGVYARMVYRAVQATRGTAGG